MKFIVGDPIVAPKHASYKGVVTEVNEKWAWVKVRFHDGKEKVYPLLDKHTISIFIDFDEINVCSEKYCGHPGCWTP